MDVHRAYVGLWQYRCASCRRGCGKADCNLRRIEIPVVTDPHCRYDPHRSQKWIEAARLFRRDQLDIKTHAASAVEVNLDNFFVLRPACNLQASRLHPIEGLTSFLRERFDLAARILDQADHQVILANAADHARGAGRGLGSDVVLVDECDDESLALLR